MSARSLLVVCGLLILGCAAPAADTVPAPEPDPSSPSGLRDPVAVAPEPGPAPATVDTGDAVAEAPEAPAPRGAHDGSDPARKVDPADPDPAPEPAPPREEGPPDAPDDAPAKAKRPIAPKPAGIEQVNDRSWTVTRALVDKWHEDPYSLGNVRENGEGWEMVAARQRPAYHLGMRNGDIVLEVNGHKLNTMPNLLAAYAACRNDEKFDVVFLRKGTRLTHHYEIR